VLGIPVLLPIPIPVAPPPGPTVIRLDRPDEDFQFPRIGDGNHIKFVGRVRHVHIGAISGGATVDASELVTGNFSVLGKIDEGSTLLATKVNGGVYLRGKIDGGSRVVLVATGSITVSDYSVKEDNGARIQGGSRLTATAVAVNVAGTVSGKGTVVDLTLKPPGALRFVVLDDKAVIRYRTEHRADPMPRVTQGKITGGAELKEEPTP
jgi:hypothetical protein